ncbi:hypothetical protein [Parabacteroides sp.]
MMELKNKIKISLFLGDVERSMEHTKNKEKFFAVKKFDYNLLKNRNELGVPNEITERTTIDFEIRAPRIDQLRELYGMMKEEETLPFSFVFNPTFGANDELEEHNGAMVIEGGLCSMSELYVSHQRHDDERMIVSASLMIYTVRYSGGANNVSPLSLTLI